MVHFFTFSCPFVSTSKVAWRFILERIELRTSSFDARPSSFSYFGVVFLFLESCLVSSRLSKADRRGGELIVLLCFLGFDNLSLNRALGCSCVKPLEDGSSILTTNAIKCRNSGFWTIQPIKDWRLRGRFRLFLILFNVHADVLSANVFCFAWNLHGCIWCEAKSSFIVVKPCFFNFFWRGGKIVLQHLTWVCRHLGWNLIRSSWLEESLVLPPVARVLRNLMVVLKV